MKHKKLIAGVLIAFAIGVSYYFWIEYVQIMPLDNFFGHIFGYPPNRREQFFTQKFVSARELSDYLSDATILHSQPPFDNDVFYFDANRRFVEWRGSQTQAGTWWSEPRLQIIIFGNRWRVVVVQIFCLSFFDIAKVAQQDNCYEVESTASILARYEAHREYRKGNVLGLAIGEGPRAQLPRSDITIESLARSLHGGGGG